MTIQEAIIRGDLLRPNKIPRPEKIRWLSELDGRIYQTLIKDRDGAPEESFAGYDDYAAPGTELLAAAPYDDIYPKWLAAQIDLRNREINNYNNSLAVFQAAYQDFANQYNRDHMRRGERLCFFGRRHKRNGYDPLSEH